MKATSHFTRTILSYLELRAETDSLFKVSFENPNKNIDDCVTYILNQVQKSGCNGFADDEIYSMAVHYYDEDAIDIGNPINCKVVVNHIVELTEEEKEKEQARQDAIQKAMNDSYQKMKRTKSKTTSNTATNQLSLF